MSQPEKNIERKLNQVANTCMDCGDPIYAGQTIGYNKEKEAICGVCLKVTRKSE